MGKQRTSGLIEEIEKVNEGLSFVTLGIIGNHTHTTKRQPVFIELSQDLKERVVDIVNIKKDNLLKQYLIGSDIFYNVSLTLSDVKQRLSNYLKSIKLENTKPETVFPYECQ